MLSIVYITCNRADEITKSIISCEAHVSIEHEYVIVDNGSKDDTEEKINALIADGMNIRYLRQESNRGVSGGRNIGFREAYGDICYFIDDDATVISDGNCLDKAYQYMQDNPNVFAMGTDCYDTVRECQLVGSPKRGTDINTITPIRNYIGCSHFIRKSALDVKYLYPDNLMYGSEELYGGMTCYRNGGIVVQYPGVKILHCPSSNTRSSREMQKRNGHVNTYVIKKYLIPGPYLFICKVMFLMRIFRFENFKLNAIKKDYALVKERYDSTYINKLSRQQVKKLISWFGFKYIV